MSSLSSDKYFQAGLRGGLAVVVIAAALFLLYRTWAVIAPLFIASVLATALWPWVTRVSGLTISPLNWRKPRVLATALIYLSSFTTAGLIV